MARFIATTVATCVLLGTSAAGADTYTIWGADTQPSVYSCTTYLGVGDKYPTTSGQARVFATTNNGCSRPMRRIEYDEWLFDNNQTQVDHDHYSCEYEPWNPICGNQVALAVEGYGAPGLWRNKVRLVVEAIDMGVDPWVIYEPTCLAVLATITCEYTQYIETYF